MSDQGFRQHSGGHCFSESFKRRFWKAGKSMLVMLILSSPGWLCSSSSPAETDWMEDHADQIQAALSSDRVSEQRRAVLALALREGYENQIVDAVVCNQVEGYLAIRMTGRASAKRLFFRLLEPATRARSLDGILLLAPEDLVQSDLIEPLQERAVTDVGLRLILSLLDSIMSRADSEHGQEPLAQKLSSAKWNSDVAAMYRVAVTFKRTRSWGVPMVRGRLERALLRLDEEGVVNEIGGLIGCLLWAARSGSVDGADIAIMDRAWHTVETRLAPPGEALPFEPNVLWAQWLGRGGKASDLLKALHCSGDKEPPYEMRFLYSFNESLGDKLLRATDTPLLISQGADEHMKDGVRIGAIRILSYLGSVENSVHDLFIKLSVADQEDIRFAVAEGIGRCVANKVQRGRLLAAVAGRLREEASPRIVSALKDAEGRLSSF